MLNPFPIQFLSLFAYAILRICVGALLLRLGVKHLRHQDELASLFSVRFLPSGAFLASYLSFVEIIIGVMFMIGFYTQIAALLALIVSLTFVIFGRKFSSPLIPPRSFYVLLAGASLSLLITGAGVFAFDLPL